MQAVMWPSEKKTNPKKIMHTSNTNMHLAAVFRHVFIRQRHALKLRDALPA